MLNGSDVQLFYKLLDSLSTSLRDLAVKYELLLRDGVERDKLSAAFNELAKEMSTSFSEMARSIAIVKDMATKTDEGNVDAMEVIRNVSKNVEQLNARLEQMFRDIGSVASVVTSTQQIASQTSEHVHTTHGQVGELLGISQKLTDVIASVDAMKADFVPIKRLAVLLTKPVAIILGIYFIITTIMAVMKGCDEFHDLNGRTNGTSQTNSSAVTKP